MPPPAKASAMEGSMMPPPPPAKSSTVEGSMMPPPAKARTVEMMPPPPVKAKDPTEQLVPDMGSTDSRLEVDETATSCSLERPGAAALTRHEQDGDGRGNEDAAPVSRGESSAVALHSAEAVSAPSVGCANSSSELRDTPGPDDETGTPAKEALPRVPPGWEVVPSQSRPGQFSYLHAETGWKQSHFPEANLTTERILAHMHKRKGASAHGRTAPNKVRKVEQPSTESQQLFFLDKQEEEAARNRSHRTAYHEEPEEDDGWCAWGM